MKKKLKLEYRQYYLNFCQHSKNKNPPDGIIYNMFFIESLNLDKIKRRILG